MLLWFKSNLATILIGVALLLIIALIVVKLVKDKRKGRSFCGGGCANCSMNGRCHK